MNILNVHLKFKKLKSANLKKYLMSVHFYFSQETLLRCTALFLHNALFEKTGLGWILVESKICLIAGLNSVSLLIKN